MILRPDDVVDSTGSISKMKLDSIEIIMTDIRILFLFAGGIMMEINIAYKARLSARMTWSGKMFPDIAPRNVPNTQDEMVIVISPYV